MDEQRKPLEQKVSEWIETSGHGLEMRVARALHPASLGVHYLDPQEEKWREIDVVKTEVNNAGNVHVHYVVEVKDTSSPWVVFRGNRSLNKDHSVVERLNVVEVNTGWGQLRRLHDCPLLFHAGATAYKAAKFMTKEPKDSDKNEPWDAMMQALSATRGLQRMLEQAASNERVEHLLVPIVLTGGPLFAADLEPFQDEVRVVPASKVLVEAQFPPDGKTRVVWVIQKDYLPHLSEEMRHTPVIKDFETRT